MTMAQPVPTILIVLGWWRKAKANARGAWCWARTLIRGKWSRGVVMSGCDAAMRQ